MRIKTTRTTLRAAFAAFPIALAIACGSSSGSAPPTTGARDTTPPGTPPPPSSTGPIKTVFLILMENHSWSTIKGAGASATYINGTLAVQGAHAEQYKTPPGNHPSEPNYIWLEAGDNLGITDDNVPAKNHQSTKDHLTTLLEAKGVTWKAYAEGITSGTCPLAKVGSDYDPKHTPQLYFDDVTDTNSVNSAHCIAHVRSFDELEGDLTSGNVAQYDFITPNLCNDMHGETTSKCSRASADLIKLGDDWLAAQIPKIMASAAYKDGGVIFVLWDEGDESGTSASDGPIPLFVLSPKAKVGYPSNTAFTHSSMLKTIQEIFGVTPLLRGAATATDLSEMFTSFP